MERPGQTSVQALSTINQDDLGLDERHRGDCSALRAASKGIFMLGGERKFMKTSVKFRQSDFRIFCVFRGYKTSSNQIAAVNTQVVPSKIVEGEEHSNLLSGGDFDDTSIVHESL